MIQFQPHQKRWFHGNIGEIVVMEATIKTPARIKETMLKEQMIASEKHAEALYLYHRDHKVNFKEKPKA